MTKTKAYWAKVEREYGYLGDRVRCRVCGKHFEFLGAHLKVHHLTEMEYKDKFELLHSLPLCIDKLSSLFSEKTTSRINDGTLKAVDGFFSSKRNFGKEKPKKAKENLSIAQSKRVRTVEERNKMSAYAKNRTQEHRNKISVGIKSFYRRAHLTKRAPDAGDSAASQALSPQSGESTPEVDPAATQRR
jgi:hypothetical protein